MKNKHIAGWQLGLLLLMVNGLVACDFFIGDQTRLDRALAYRQKGNYQAAVIELKKILDHDSKNGQAWLQMGEVSLLLEKPADAEQGFRRAAEAGVPKQAYVASLGKSLLESGKFKEVLDTLSPAGLSPALQEQVKILQAQAYLGLGEQGISHAAFLAVLTDKPDSIDALLGLARIAQLQGAADDAAMYIETALKVNPKHVPARLFKAELAFVKKAYAQSEAIFSEVVQDEAALLPSELFAALSARAESLMRMGNKPEFKKSVQLLQEKFPSHPRTLFLAGSVAYDDGELEKARELLQQILTSIPNYLPAQILMGGVNYQLGNLEQADLILSEVLSVNPGNAQVRKMLAATRIRRQQPDEAVAILEPVTSAAEDGEALSLAGRARLQSGETAEGLVLLERGARLAPGNQSLQMDLAGAYLGAGDFDHAIETLTKLENSGDDEYRRDVLLVMAYTRSRNWQEALKVCAQMTAKMPKDARPLLLAAGVSAARGATEEAREYYGKVLQLEPKNVSAEMGLGRLALRARDTEAAQGHFEKVLSTAPKNFDAAIAMAQLNDLVGMSDKAVEWLRKGLEMSGNSERINNLLIRYLLQQKRYAEAGQEAAALLKKTPGSVYAVNVMATSLMGQKKYPEAEKVLSDALNKSGAAVLHYNLGRVRLAMNNLDKARSSFVKVLALEPANLPALESLVMLEVRAGTPDRAHKVVEDYRKKHGEHERLAVIEGDVFAAEKRFPEAIRLFEQFLQQHPDDSAVATRLFSALRRTNPAKAQAALEGWVEKFPADAKARFILAEHYQFVGNNKNAIVSYEKLLATQPDNAAVLNNLAWLYQLQGDSRALKTAEQAAALMPANPAVQDTLGWILLKNGQLDKGMQVIQPLAERLPQDADVQYHYAYGLYKQGQIDQAKRLLEKVLGQNKAFTHAADAKALYDQLKN